MATRSATRAERDDNVVTITWQGLVGSADDGDSVGVADIEDLTFQVVGDFGTGGNVTMQGSNDGTNFGSLLDDSASAATVSDSTVVALKGTPLFIKPNGSAGSAADMDVIVTGRKVR